MDLRILESPVADNACRKQIMGFIHGEAWRPFYERELSLGDEFHRHWHVTLEEAGRMIAHCHVCRSLRHGACGQFSFLEVHKDFQGRGLARTAYRAGMDILEHEGVKTVFLETDLKNIARGRIYLKDGFTDIFVSPDGMTAMVKGQPLEPRAGRPAVLEYADYAMADVLLNLKLGRLADKSRLPLNAYGKRGSYCLFRDRAFLPELKASASGGVICDVEFEEMAGASRSGSLPIPQQ